MDFLKGIFNYKYYDKVYKRSLKYGIIYAFILSIIVYFIWSMSVLYKVNNYVKTEITQFVYGLPQFAIQNGQLSIANNEVIKYESGKSILLVDATGQSNISSLNKYSNIIFLSKENITFRSNAINQKFKYSDILGNLKLSSIDKKYLISSIPLINMVIKDYLMLFFVCFYFIWLLFYKIFSVLILYIIAMIIDSSKNTGLLYKGLFNVTAYAITLPWLIKVVYYGSGLNNYISWFVYVIIYWSIGIFYIYKAINEFKIRKNNEELVDIQEFTLE